MVIDFWFSANSEGQKLMAGWGLFAFDMQFKSNVIVDTYSVLDTHAHIILIAILCRLCGQHTFEFAYGMDISACAKSNRVLFCGDSKIERDETHDEWSRWVNEYKRTVQFQRRHNMMWFVRHIHCGMLCDGPKYHAINVDNRCWIALPTHHRRRDEKICSTFQHFIYGFDVLFVRTNSQKYAFVSTWYSHSTVHTHTTHMIMDVTLFQFDRFILATDSHRIRIVCGPCTQSSFRNVRELRLPPTALHGPENGCAAFFHSFCRKLDSSSLYLL